MGKAGKGKILEKKEVVEKIERYFYNPRRKHRYLPRRRLIGLPDSKIDNRSLYIDLNLGKYLCELCANQRRHEKPHSNVGNKKENP
jgi:hypothetical protein